MTDLRVLKTKNAIENAFYELRKKKKLEDIKVKELCEKAIINKTTFYNYYQDVYELSDELENRVLDEVLQEYKEISKGFTKTEDFIFGLYKVLVNNKNINILFGDRNEIILEKGTKLFLEYFKKKINNDEKKMYVLFFVRGAFYILFNFKYDEKKKFAMLIDIADYISKNKINT